MFKLSRCGVKPGHLNCESNYRCMVNLSGVYINQLWVWAFVWIASGLPAYSVMWHVCVSV